jgi:branched-chain amino acid transport system permease protein
LSALLQIVLSGLGAGAVYALIALGFSIVYKVTRAINFAHGELLMVAGITASVLNSRYQLPLVLTVAIVIVLGAAMGVVVDLVAVRLLNRPDPLTVTLGTVAVGIAVQAVMLLITHGISYSLPGFSGDLTINVFGALLQSQTVWNLGIGLVCVVGLTLFFARTRRGVSLRASADDKDTAAIFGVSFVRATTWGFALAGALAATAGVAITPVTLMSYNQGTELGLVGFAAAILGGLGSMPGAVIGGLIVGLAEALVAGYVTSTYASAAGFVILLLVLFIRPSGLFRAVAVERV